MGVHMKLLLVPCATGSRSHQIPLLALARRFRAAMDSKLQIMFLLPNRDKPTDDQDSSARSAARQHFDFIDAVIWPEDYYGSPERLAQMELKVYREFAPDIVIDDFNEATTLAMQSWRIPRISIQRTGIFPSVLVRNPAHCHSALKSWIRVLDHPRIPIITRAAIYSRIKRYLEPDYFFRCFEADSKLIPGIPGIECLPPSLQGDSSYDFCGPLILETPESQFPGLEEFFDQNRDRKIIFVSVGLFQRPGLAIRRCIAQLIREGTAVISTFPPAELDDQCGSRSFVRSFLPLDRVCSEVDLVVHQCGSGIYHYPLLHRKASVTIGTQCYDREDVARILEARRLSVHIPAPEECTEFEEQFCRTVLNCLERPHDFFDSELMLRVSAEIRSTMEDFDFRQLLFETVDRFRCGISGESSS
jgi:UDP:flavonoid glycosyltransferase YjiC (YdhE family)